MSVSLEGYITGPNPNVGNGLGDGGDRLHQWLYSLASFEETTDARAARAAPSPTCWRRRPGPPARS
jgi:hypothetical protein